MSASDKRPSRDRSAPPLGAIMVDRLRTALGATDSAFLYRNEALDVLAFTLTGLPSGPQRDAVFDQTLAVLEDIARPASEVALATLRGAA